MSSVPSTARGPAGSAAKPRSAGSSGSKSSQQGSASGSGAGRSTTGGSKAKSAPGKPVAGAGNISGNPKKVSDRLNPKTIDPFTPGAKKTSAFASLYTSGSVPCRLVHGSVKHKLAWNPIPEEVPLDPVLVTLAEGIRETVHPYMFVARQGFKELLEIHVSDDTVVLLVPKLVPPIRAALGHSDATVFGAGLDALLQLSFVAGTALNPHLKTLLVSLGKHSMQKNYKEKVMDALQELERNGGKDALMQIKSKVPIYQSVQS